MASTRRCGYRRSTPFALARPALTPIELPLSPHSIEVAQAHRYPRPRLGQLSLQLSTRAFGVTLEPLPQQRLRLLAKLAPGTKDWTGFLRKVRLVRRQGHYWLLWVAFSQYSLCACPYKSMSIFLFNKIKNLDMGTQNRFRSPYKISLRRDNSVLFS